MDSQAHPLPHGLSWSSPLCSVRFPRGIPFFDPAGMLVDFDRGAVQHQCCFLHQVLLNQGCEDIFPYSGFCPGTEPPVYTLPWPEPLRKIPPWYSGVQPIQDCIKHFQITFSWPASLRLFFRRKLILDPIPLFFAYFMSFHVLYFIIFARCTQYISFKTDSSVHLANHTDAPPMPSGLVVQIRFGMCRWEECLQPFLPQIPECLHIREVFSITQQRTQFDDDNVLQPVQDVSAVCPPWILHPLQRCP